MMQADLPELMTLRDVLKRLKGKVGRTALLAHLAKVPTFFGDPTHGRLGRRYLFTAAQYRTLIASLAAPPVPREGRSEHAWPSEERAQARALVLIDEMLGRKRKAGRTAKRHRSNGAMISR